MESKKRLKSKREELTYYSELDASISHELSAATDLGLNLSFLYNKKEKKFTSFQNELLDRFSDESLSDSLGVSDYSAYENNAISDGRRIKLLLESFLWKEIMEVGGGPISLYSMLGYKFDSINYTNSNTKNSFGNSYSEAKADLSNGYLATDLFIPLLHSLSLSWSARLESQDWNFYQRSFIDYKIAQSLFRFAFSSGAKSATLNEKKVSSYNNEDTIYDNSIFESNWVGFDVLAKNDLDRESFRLYELGFHQSLFTSIDIDINLWSRDVSNAIIRPNMDDYLNYISDEAVISKQDSTIYHLTVSPTNADYISKKGLDSQLIYFKKYSSSQITISEKFSYIFEDYLKYKSGSKLDRKGLKNHPIFRETLTISYETPRYFLSFSEYSSSATRERYKDKFMKYTRAYSIMAQYKHDYFEVSLFANDFGGERAQIDPSENSAKTETDEYSLIAGANLGISLEAKF